MSKLIKRNHGSSLLPRLGPSPLNRVNVVKAIVFTIPFSMQPRPAFKPLILKDAGPGTPE